MQHSIHQCMRHTPLIICKGKLHKHLERCYCMHKQAQQVISTVRGHPGNVLRSDKAVLELSTPNYW